MGVRYTFAWKSVHLTGSSSSCPMLVLVLRIMLPSVSYSNVAQPTLVSLLLGL